MEIRSAQTRFFARRNLLYFIFSVILLVAISNAGHSQIYYGVSSFPCETYKITVGDDNCSCEVELLHTSTAPGCPGEDAAYCGDGNLYINGMDGIYQYDVVSGIATLAFPFPATPLWPIPGFGLTGLACADDSIFYFDVFDVLGTDNWLYQFDATTGVMTNLGEIPFQIGQGISFANGNLYGGFLYGI